MNQIRKTLEGNSNGEIEGGIARTFQVFMTLLISANVLFMIIETEQEVSAQYGSFFEAFEIASIVIFITEYAARLITCKTNPHYKEKRFSVFRFALSPLMLIDLIAIMPFFLPFVIDLRFVRVVRLLRMFRLFKMTKYSESLTVLAYVLRKKSRDMLSAFVILFIVLIMSSSMMYLVERDAQPEIFSSIPESMWWGLITLTTIGYGDTYPVTPAGKIIASGVALIGIAVYAIPAGIMASAFAEAHKNNSDRSNDSVSSTKGRCPHCGRD